MDSIVGGEWPAFDWPTLPEWAWPDYLDWVWPEFIWDWPGLHTPEYGWRFRRPSWWGSSVGAMIVVVAAVVVAAAVDGDAPGKNAAGTLYWGGGLSWLGEWGEKAALPRGRGVEQHGERGDGAGRWRHDQFLWHNHPTIEMDLQTLEYRLESAEQEAEAVTAHPDAKAQRAQRTATATALTPTSPERRGERRRVYLGYR